MADAPKRPFFLTLCAIVLSAHAVMLPIFVVKFVLLEANSTMILNDEPVHVGDHRIKLLVSLLVWWSIAFGLAFGLWKRRPWTRPGLCALFVIPYAIVALVGLIQLDPTLFLLSTAIAYLFWWYLYRKKSVVDYFNSS